MIGEHNMHWRQECRKYEQGEAEFFCKSPSGRVVTGTPNVDNRLVPYSFDDSEGITHHTMKFVGYSVTVPVYLWQNGMRTNESKRITMLEFDLSDESGAPVNEQDANIIFGSFLTKAKGIVLEPLIAVAGKRK